MPGFFPCRINGADNPEGEQLIELSASRAPRKPRFCYVQPGPTPLLSARRLFPHNIDWMWRQHHRHVGAAADATGAHSDNANDTNNTDDADDANDSTNDHAADDSGSTTYNAHTHANTGGGDGVFVRGSFAKQYRGEHLCGCGRWNVGERGGSHGDAHGESRHSAAHRRSPFSVHVRIRHDGCSNRGVRD